MLAYLNDIFQSILHFKIFLLKKHEVYSSKDAICQIYDLWTVFGDLDRVQLPSFLLPSFRHSAAAVFYHLMCLVMVYCGFIVYSLDRYSALSERVAPCPLTNNISLSHLPEMHTGIVLFLL